MRVFALFLLLCSVSWVDRDLRAAECDAPSKVQAIFPDDDPEIVEDIRRGVEERAAKANDGTDVLQPDTDKRSLDLTIGAAKPFFDGKVLGIVLHKLDAVKAVAEAVADRPLA